MSPLETFIRDEDGLVVIEYVIGAAGLIVVVTLLFSGIGTSLLSKLSGILDSF
jgi:pilus assembly protein Flp/PilA